MIPISVAPGDGIGPEIMATVLDVFAAVNAPLKFERVAMGRTVAESGDRTGISFEARQSVESTGILFKGPMETPKGGGYKSVNVTARKMWGTFANKRVYKSLPGVWTPTTNNIALTMVRENIEDTYGGVEHMQTPDVAQCRRFITRPGSRQVHRYSFELAKRQGARRITCGHKANIMKQTDGLFLETFYEVAKEYPELNADDVIVDAMAMKLVLDPTEFDVIVLPNLQGDILTDLAAGLVGGLAYAPSANIGDGICIFEAVHGTAPDIVGKDLANPTALLLSGTMLLRHLGLDAHADAVDQALTKVLLDEQKERESTEGWRFSGQRFREQLLAAASALTVPDTAVEAPPAPVRSEPRMMVTPDLGASTLRGLDIFLESSLGPAELGAHLDALDTPIPLVMISNRGTQVWPKASVHTDCVDHYRVRFESEQTVDQTALIATMSAVGAHYPMCSAEWLREIGGKRGYSLAQGQG